MKVPLTLFALCALLIAAAVIAGCSDTGDEAAGSGTAAVTTTAPSHAYSAGDIVRSPTGSESPAWLVVGYDPAADSYTRALIYRNADGSYGYRTNGATETLARSTMEKIYSVKIAHVSVSSVPTAAPTTAAPVTTETTEVPATTAAAATTTLPDDKPAIKSLSPEDGTAGLSVSPVITGSGFLKNLTAILRRSGDPDIVGHDVVWSSSSIVTVTFDLPNTTKMGNPWDVVLTNPNGQSGEYRNYFIIHANTSVG